MERLPVPMISSTLYVNKDGIVTFPNGERIRYWESSKGYLRVRIQIGDQRISTSVHRLMASVYLGLDILDRETQVDHINGNKLDNRLENLRLVSNHENMIYRAKRENDTIELRRCAKCEVMKPVSEFRSSKKTSSGYHSYCNECHRRLNNEYGNKLRLIKLGVKE